MREHAAHTGRETAATRPRAQTPKAPRSKAHDDELPFTDEHSIDFADDRVGIGGKFERVRQECRIDRVADDGQLRGAADDVRPVLKAVRRDDRLAARAAARQKLARAAPGPNLQQLPAKDIFQRLGEKFRFGRQQGFAERLLPPSLQGRLAIENV